MDQINLNGEKQEKSSKSAGGLTAYLTFSLMDGSTKLSRRSRASKDPDGCDVLFGRGAACYHHPGNKRYREIVKDRSIDYASAKTFVDKRDIASQIIAQLRVESPKLRFLNKNKDTGEWEEVDDKQVKSKIQQALREKIIPPWKKRDETQSDPSAKQARPTNADTPPKPAERKSICMLDLHMRLMYLGECPHSPRLEEALRHVQSFLEHVEMAIGTAEHIAGIGGANPMTLQSPEDTNRGSSGASRLAGNAATGRIEAGVDRKIPPSERGTSTDANRRVRSRR